MGGAQFKCKSKPDKETTLALMKDVTESAVTLTRARMLFAGPVTAPFLVAGLAV